MTILIRENKTLDGEEFKNIKVFKSDRILITREDENKAIELDNYISTFFCNLIEEVKQNQLLQLKGKSGVIELWYHVGTKLVFIDNPQIVEPGDKKYIWKALWYHAAELAPGEMKTRAGTNRDHFFYCYRLAKYEKDFVLNAGNWRSWQDFFDSPILSNDIVLEWFNKKHLEIKKLKIKNWLRDFIANIRNTFQNIDMSFLKQEEIYRKLDDIFSGFVQTIQKSQAEKTI